MTMLSPAMPDNRVGDLPTPPAPRLRLKLIGAMDAWSVTSERVLPRVRKTRAVVAILALAAPRPVSRQKLSSLLWSTRDREQARASLRQALHELSIVLAPCGAPLLHADRDQAWIDAGAVWVDALEVVRADPVSPALLDLLDGTLLEGLDGLDPAMDSWLASERRSFRDRARTAIERLLETTHDAEARIEVARHLIALDEAHEAAWRALIEAHATRGERSRALEAFESCRSALARLLGATPSPDTLALAESLRVGAEPEAQTLVRSEAKLAPKRSVTRGARLGIAPLRSASGADDTDFALGLAEEMTTALARLRWIAVVSSASLASLGDAVTNPEAVRNALDLDFLLAGTVQRDAARVRVSLRLLDLRAGGEVVWAQRFDQPAADLLALQDEIAAAVVARIDPEILLIEARRAASAPGRDASAYSLVLSAIPAIYRLEKDSFLKAGRMLEEAIVREPEDASAHAWYAYWHIFLVGQGWAEDQREAMVRAGQLAERAIVLDPQDARAFAIAGHVRAYLHRRLGEAMTLHERAISLNPNLPMAWVLSGVAHAYAGNHEEALKRILRYRRLSPLDPHAFFFDVALEIVYLLSGRYDQAIELGRQLTEVHPGLSAAWKPYVAALALAGRKPEAEEAARRLLALEPGFSVARFLAMAPFAREEDRELFARGLREAGVPEA